MSRSTAGPARTRRALVVIAVAACLAALVIVASQFPGYAGSSVTATVRTVWVTNPAQFLLGRINRQIDELDSSAALSSADFDVRQDGSDVFAVDNAAHQLRRVDPATVTLSEPLDLPDHAVVALGGGVLAIGDTATGRVWTRSADRLGTGDLVNTAPAATVAPGVVLAVGTDGSVAATAPGQRRLTLIPNGTPTTGDGDRAETVSLGRALSAASTDHPAPVALAMVGSTPVVLDRQAGVLLAPGPGQAGERVLSLPRGASDLALQQSGPAADAVLVATGSALLRVTLADGAVGSFDTGTSGAPAAPVWLDGCAHGAWSGRHPTYLAWCGSTPTIRPLPTRPGGTGGPTGHALVFRVNRAEIVLNDLATGDTYLLGEHLTVINNWSQVAPPREQDSDPSGSRGDENDSDQVTLSRANCTGAVTAPTASDDTFGVRAGRPAIVPVMANDATTDCAAVIIDSVSALPADAGSVAIVDGGRALQVTAAEGATGRLPPLTYRLSDAAGHTSSATVALRVVPAGEHPPPERLRGSATMVGVGGRITADVLADWYSPAGDPLWLTAVSTQGQALSATFRPGGAITVRDSGTSGPGKRTVTFALTDGVTVKHGTLTVQVVPPEDAVPLASPVFAQTTAGTPVTVRPLDSVLVPGTGAPRLSAVTPDPVDGDPPAGLTVSDIPDSGVVTITAAAPGDFRLHYQVTAGTLAATGVLRIRVTNPAAARTDPVAVTDVGYLAPDGQIRLDLTGNDVSVGRPLAIQQIHLPPGSPLVVTVSAMQVAQVAARRPLPDAGSWFSYTVSDGTAAATGWVHIVPVAQTAGQGPVASPATLVVRAGDAGTLPLAAVAQDPDGNAMTVQDFQPLPPGQGLLFGAGDAIRYLAPITPVGPISTVYSVTDTAGRSASAPLTIVVKPRGDNSPPGTPPVATLRVFAGGTGSVSLPLAGIDPDGDWVTATRLVEAGTLGAATIREPTVIRYAAGSRPGTDVLTYRATDPSGASVIGRVDVVVVPLPDVVQPPVAPDLKVAVAPGGTIGVDVLATVTDPAGLAVRFADAPAESSGADGTAGPEGSTADGRGAIRVPAGSSVTARIDHSMLVVTAGPKPVVVPVGYTVVNARGLSASGVVTVTVTPDAPPVPPTADDVFATSDMLSTNGTRVVVDVANHVANPGGTLGDLQVAVPDVGDTSAEPTGRLQVTVPLTSARQVVAYQVRNAAGLTAAAFIVVPTEKELAPRSSEPGLNPKGVSLTVTAGTEVSIDIRQQITGAPPGRSLTVPANGRVSAAVGDLSRTDATHLRWRVPDDASGQAVLLVDVTDGQSTARASIVATIRPAQPPAPTFASPEIEVAAGGSTPVDLAALTTPGKQGMTLTFAGPTGQGRGVTGTLAGGTLTVSAAPTATKGTTVNLGITVDDGIHPKVPGTVHVTVVASTAPLAWIPEISRGGQQGVPVQVDVLTGAQNPVADAGPLRVVGATVIRGAGQVRYQAGGTVSITPGTGQVGDLVVQVTVADATGDPDREVTGTVTVTVVGKPGRVTGVSVLTHGDRTVQLSWDAPAANGEKIDYYLVRATSGPFQQRCAASPCRLTGLTNNVAYRFTVTAHNAIGNAPVSAPSAAVTPDVAPDAPAAPDLAFGDGSITATWKAPADRGSPITGYRVSITPAPTSGAATVTVRQGTSVTFRRLTNGTSYQVTVVARNSSGDDSDPSPPATMIPAAPPDTPRPPGLTYLPDKGQVQVSWKSVAGNGDDALTYRMQWTGDDGTSGWSEVSAGDDLVGTIGQAVLGVTYRATVAASNKAGRSGTSRAGTVRAFTAVGAPGAVTATATGADHTVAVTWTAPAYSGWDIGSYAYQIDGAGEWVPLPARTSATITDDALTNGKQHTVAIHACTVQAADACGTGASSGAVTPFGKPVAVTDLAAAPGDGSIALTWSAPDGNGMAIAGYEYSLDGGTTWTDTGKGTETGVTVPKLDGVRYRVQVRAFHDVDGDGKFADASNTVVLIGPPRHLDVVDSGQTWVKFAWEPPETSGQTSYRYRANGGSPQENAYATVSTSCGTAVSLSVVAIDADGNVSEAASTSGSTKACPPTYPTGTVTGAGAPVFASLYNLTPDGNLGPYGQAQIECWNPASLIDSDGGDGWFKLASGQYSGQWVVANNFPQWRSLKSQVQANPCPKT